MEKLKDYPVYKGLSGTRLGIVLLLLISAFFYAETFCPEKANAFAETLSEIDLREVVIITAKNLSSPEKMAVEMLVDKVKKRTWIHWESTQTWPADNIPVIVVGQEAFLETLYARFSKELSAGSARKTESYRIFVEKESRSASTVFVTGADPRGVLFGTGRLLRELRMSKEKIALSAEFNIKTAPAYPLRGHQLGFRPKANSYDAWTPEMWEQYIQDLVVFGTNAIELIPPRSDDDDDSPHFPLSKIDMMICMSQIADQFDLDVWIWYPAMDADYSDPKTVEFSLNEWGEVFKKLPRIDVVFVPGGDPGHTHPEYLMAMMKKQTDVLHRYHPNAQMWISPQSFNREWLEDFYNIIRKKDTGWLSGIVFGPQICVSLPELRRMVPERYPIRRYPDITHSLHCQYPVPDWDLAFALTESREVINPRPRGEAVIFHMYKDYAIGSLTYSEGCNDDVNKIIWSALGWDPEADVVEILRQYSRYFISNCYTNLFAQGLLALEKNWQGPLLSNESVYTTLQQFQEMERFATPQVLLNWRFQQALYRAYYDAYVRSRLIYETGLEERAMDVLREAPQTGSMIAIDRARAILNLAEIHKPSFDWRARVFELAEALFQSIRMQLSVGRYKAIAVRRGANLDEIDVPLNNMVWLKQRFSELLKLTDEKQRLEGIAEIVNWTNPGPGGYYDDLGNLSCQPHLVRGAGFEKDPDFLQSSLVGHNNMPGWRMSWCRNAGALNDAPLQMYYTDLAPDARYKIRVVYGGDNFRTKIRLLADDDIQIHPLIKKEFPVRPVEFDIPVEATCDGELTLTWYRESGWGGNGRGCQVSEVWLIKKTK